MTNHLEESNARIQADNYDRRKLWERQYQCMDRFDPSGHFATVFIRIRIRIRMFIYLTHIHYRNIDMIINIKKVDPETPAKTSLVANAGATKI